MNQADADIRRRGGNGQARPLPKPPTEERLWNAALAYLQRFAASQGMVEAVLGRRIDRAARAGVIEAEAGRALLARVMKRMAASGLLDDLGFARARAETLFRQGRGGQWIAQALAAKGLSRTLIDAALAGLVEDHGDVALIAARRFAQRRRLGPWRNRDRAAHRDRDLAAMGRAGHAYEIARRVIDDELPSPR